MDESKRPHHRVFADGVEVENTPFTDEEWAEWNAQLEAPVVDQTAVVALSDAMQDTSINSIAEVKKAVLDFANSFKGL